MSAPFFNPKLVKFSVLAFLCVTAMLGTVALADLFAIIVSAPNSDMRLFDSQDEIVDSLSRTIRLYFLAMLVQVLATIGFLTSVMPRRAASIGFLAIPFVLGVSAPFTALSAFLSPAVGPFSVPLLASSNSVTAWIVLIDTWQWVGLLILLCAVRLQTTTSSLLDEATMLGLTAFARCRLILLPALLPTLVIYCAVRLTDWLRKTDAIRVFTGDGGFGNTARTLPILIHKWFFIPDAKSLSATLILLQLLLLMLVYWVVFRHLILRRFQ